MRAANFITVIKQSDDFNFQIARCFKGMQRVVGHLPAADNGDALAKPSLARDGPRPDLCHQAAEPQMRGDSQRPVEKQAALKGNEKIIERLIGRAPAIMTTAADFRKVQPPLTRADAL